MKDLSRAHASPSVGLPYFDLLLEVRVQDEVAAKTYGRHVHWGYWNDPARASTDPEAFAAAMAMMDVEVRAAATLEDGHAVLDVGCGFGGTLNTIHAELRDVALVGLNVDGRQLAIAGAQVPAARFVQADACHLPFAGASFDRVLAIESIFHFPSRLRFVQESARVLKAGGRLALSDFVMRGVRWTQNPVGRALERHLTAGFGPLGNRWPDGDYRAIAKAAGMTIVVDRNITSHTLPTYSSMLKLFGRRLDMPAVRRMVSPTLLLHGISRLGLLQYRILAMEKRA